MITQFTNSEDERSIAWVNNGQEVTLKYEYPVVANQIDYLNQVIVQSDIRESGSRNLAIYNADGTLKAQPDMPILKHPVEGVYAVWFVQGERYQTVKLLTDDYKPYDTACMFDLETYTFTSFHPSR